MPQVITRLEQIPNVASLTLAANVGYVRDSGNSAWEVAPLARTNAANTFTGSQTISSGNLVIPSSSNGISIGTTTVNAGRLTIVNGGANALTITGVGNGINLNGQILRHGDIGPTFGLVTFIAQGFGFATAADPGTPNAVITRDETTLHCIGQRNGTNAQTYRVYNTFTSTTNYERGKLEWSSNVFNVGTEKGSGGGTARAMTLMTDGTARITIGTAGELGFYGSAAVAKQSVTGSRGGNAALADLLSKLATVGLITDGTSA